MNKTKLVNIRKLANVIRSKNAGPFELTFDIIFKNKEIYETVKKTKIINEELIAKLYNITIDRILVFKEYDLANAIKFTIKRPKVSGDPGDADVYGCQQHIPLLYIEIPLEQKNV